MGEGEFVMTTWVWLDGQVRTADRARLSATDRGLLAGYGVFETITMVGSQPFALTRHLQRLRASAAVVHIAVPWSDDDLRAACAATVDAATADDKAHGVAGERQVRVTITAGPAPSSDGTPSQPTLVVTVSPRPPHRPTATVTMSPWPVNHRSPLVGAKTTSRLELTLAHRYAGSVGADEAVSVNTDDVLVEGSASNLFVVVAGRLSTPALSTGCLPGVTRALVCELVDVAERDDLTVSDLHLASEAFLTSTNRGIQPITSVDGSPMRTAPGPLTAQAMAALDQLKASSLDP